MADREAIRRCISNTPLFIHFPARDMPRLNDLTVLYESRLAMIIFFKFLISLFAGFVVLFFLTTVISIFTLNSDLVSALISLPFASFVAWSIWRSISGNEIGTWFYCLSGALLIGAISFIIGFIGPMLIAAGGNQGPMLGLFITGPIGTIIGAIAGLIYAKRRESNE